MSPHYTLVSMSFPVLLSLVAEPLTGLFDTAFISRLGSVPLAAVGVGTTALSCLYWAFNFLGIGTQTEVANAYGKQDISRARQFGTLALLLSGIIGVLLIGIVYPFSSKIVSLMGATGNLHNQAVDYFQIRLLGAPAVLISIASFGVLRGLQDMRTPMKIAVGLNTINIVLDAVLIFGLGPVPALGVAGAAMASTISQWIGAIWAVMAVNAGFGFSSGIRIKDGQKLFLIGGDLFVRTGMIALFMLLTTRAATLMGQDSGAAHQAIRQSWIFTILLLDAYAISGQSLVGYFMGNQWLVQARRVAKVVCLWSLGIGLLLGFTMYAAQGLVAHLLVPVTAREVFGPAWVVTCAVQPLNALAFGTDGILWGASDFKFLRNVATAATLGGISALYLVDENLPGALTWIWVITGFWIVARATFGVTRIWPGIGRSPLARNQRF